MLKFYMDESGLGKNKDEVVCCVAGFVARSSDWKKFQKHWRGLLDAYRLDEFHAKEFWARRADGGLTGKYSGWSFGDAKDFILKAVQLVLDYRLFLLGSVINLSHFFSYSLEERRYLTGARFDFGKQKFISTGKPGAAYFVPFNAVIVKGTEIGRDKEQLVHFVFDEQNEFAPRALERIAEMRTAQDGVGLKEFLGDAIYSSSSRVLPLQVADLAAYICKEYYKREMSRAPIDFEDRAVITPLEVLKQLLEPPDSHSLFKLEKPELDAMLKWRKSSQEGII